MLPLRAAAPIVAALLLVQPASDPAPLTVSAAVSLTEALEGVAQAYANAGGGPVRFNLAASNVLARQIAAGAPVDLFISADQAQMDLVERSGAIDPGTRVELLSNRLAVVTRAPLKITDVQGLAKAGLRAIAIGDPEAVPAGAYARQYLETVGQWAALRPRLVPVGSVRAALAAVENGGADAAFVYESDVTASRRAVLAFVVSGPGSPRIVYPAAIVRRGPNRAGAERFLAFLASSTASAIFERFRFTAAGGSR
jgi:molybdate transport system substrate-binding protein